MFSSTSLNPVADGVAGARAARWLAAGGLAVFVICLMAEHLLSSLDPARHEISEYVHGSAGWLMTLGFAAWAVSLAASAIYVWLSLGSRVLAALLAAASVAIVIVACFPTQTSAGSLPAGVALSFAGRLHDIGSGLTSVALLAGAVVSVFERRLPPAFRRAAAWLVALAVLSDLGLLAVGPSVGGIRQRVLVLVGVAWQGGLLAARTHRDHIDR